MIESLINSTLDALLESDNRKNGIQQAIFQFMQPAFFDAKDNRERRKRAEKLAKSKGTSAHNIALAWVLSRGPHVTAIPGTTSVGHVRENQAAEHLAVDPTILARAGELIDTGTVSGPRYPARQSAEVDAESFDDAA